LERLRSLFFIIDNKKDQVKKTMTHTDKQEVLNNIVDTIGLHVKTLKQHKGAVHELNIIIELSKVYERLSDVETEDDTVKVVSTIEEALSGLKLKQTHK